MLNTIDLANYDGPARGYVILGEGLVTLCIKLGTADAEDSPILKLRFNTEQWDSLAQLVAVRSAYPGNALNPEEQEEAAP